MPNDEMIAKIVDASRDSGLIKYLLDQQKWSQETFGAGTRTEGIVEHIKKELDEILRNPYDPLEWIDVIILALDGFWRHGHPPNLILHYLREKQRINFAREWPKDRGENEAIEHIRNEKVGKTDWDNLRPDGTRHRQKRFDGVQEQKEFRPISGCCGEAEE